MAVEFGTDSSFSIFNGARVALLSRDARETAAGCRVKSELVGACKLASQRQDGGSRFSPTLEDDQQTVALPCL